MGPESILLSVLQGGREGSYRFTCPACLHEVEKRADRKIVALLVSAGVDISASRAVADEPPATLFDQALLEAPQEDEEEEQGHDGEPAGSHRAPLTIDELIDFHFRLQDDAYIAEFLARQH